MKAPFIWIIFPGVVALGLFLLRRWYRSTVLAGVILCLILAILGWQLPIGKIISLGSWSFQVDETLTVLGRKLILGDQDRSILLMVYLMASFWFGAAYFAKAGRLFVPMGLAIVTLLTAALAVEPFLYAALLIEVAALVSVPMLLTPGKPFDRGILRYITFQTLGMPFILFTEWMVAGVETTPGNIILVMRAAALLGFGFAFLLAVPPFHTWVVMLAEGSNPYSVSFVVTMLPWMVSLLGLAFLERYTWLRNSEMVQLVLRLSGLLMALTGGIGIAFQRQLGRIFGFAVLADIGFSIMALGLPPGGYQLFFAMILPKAISFGVWALALAILKSSSEELNFSRVRGLAKSMPVATAGLILSHLSVAGFPLLAGFPVRLALWQEVAKISSWQASLAFVAGLGLIISALRTLSVLVAGSDEQDLHVTETWQSVILLGLGIIALLFVGLFPQWFLPSLVNGLLAFTHLGP